MKKPGPANKAESGHFGAEHRVRTGDLRLGKATRPRQQPTPAPSAHQPFPSVHSGSVPQVFQDGAKPLDVAQVAMLLGWTRDAIRAACDRGDLAHSRDHLNAYRIPCSAVAA